MKDGLGRVGECEYLRRLVLILVLMEDGLGHPQRARLYDIYRES